MDIKSFIFGILATLIAVGLFMIIYNIIKRKRYRKGYNFINEAYSFGVEISPEQLKEFTDNVYDEEVYEITYFDSEATETIDSIDEEIDKEYTFEQMKNFINNEKNNI
jgi:hypothetical protein